MELLGYVASGYTIEEAAERVFLARQSAYNVLSAARERASCKTVAQLAVRAVTSGWLEMDDGGIYRPAVVFVS
jgi:DNA-binding CsgD family transcriptional regulator